MAVMFPSVSQNPGRWGQKGHPSLPGFFSGVCSSLWLSFHKSTLVLAVCGSWYLSSWMFDFFCPMWLPQDGSRFDSGLAFSVCVLPVTHWWVEYWAGMGQTPAPTVTLMRDKRPLRRLDVVIGWTNNVTLMFTSCSGNPCLWQTSFKGCSLATSTS